MMTLQMRKTKTIHVTLPNKHPLRCLFLIYESNVVTVKRMPQSIRELRIAFYQDQLSTGKSKKAVPKIEALL